MERARRKGKTRGRPDWARARPSQAWLNADPIVPRGMRGGKRSGSSQWPTEEGRGREAHTKLKAPRPTAGRGGRWSGRGKDKAEKDSIHLVNQKSVGEGRCVLENDQPSHHLRLMAHLAPAAGTTGALTDLACAVRGPRDHSATLSGTWKGIMGRGSNRRGVGGKKIFSRGSKRRKHVGKEVWQECKSAGRWKKPPSTVSGRNRIRKLQLTGRALLDHRESASGKQAAKASYRRESRRRLTKKKLNSKLVKPRQRGEGEGHLRAPPQNQREPGGTARKEQEGEVAGDEK